MNFYLQILKSCRQAQSLKLGGMISTESMTSLEMILSFTINKEGNSDRKTHLMLPKLRFAV